MPVTLTNLNEQPPFGYRYHESAVGFRTTAEMAQAGLEVVAKALLNARQQNPAYNKEATTYEACVAAIKLYTCKRLKSTPRIFQKFCTDPEEEARLAAEAETKPVRSIVFGSRGATVRSCKGCGGKRK
jgi:hypothetical protein